MGSIDFEKLILEEVANSGSLNTFEFAKDLQQDHQLIVGAIKSIQSVGDVSSKFSRVVMTFSPIFTWFFTIFCCYTLKYFSLHCLDKFRIICRQKVAKNVEWCSLKDEKVWILKPVKMERDSFKLFWYVNFFSFYLPVLKFFLWEGVDSSAVQESEGIYCFWEGR